MGVETQVANDAINVAEKTFKAVISGVAFFFTIAIGNKIKDSLDRKRIFKEELLRTLVAQRVATLAAEPDNKDLQRMIRKANGKNTCIYWENIPTVKWDEFVKEAKSRGVEFVKSDLIKKDGITQVCVHENDKATCEKIAEKLGFSLSFDINDLVSEKEFKEMFEAMAKTDVKVSEDKEAQQSVADEIAEKINNGESAERDADRDFPAGEEPDSPKQKETPSKSSIFTSIENRVDPVELLGRYEMEKKAAEKQMRSQNNVRNRKKAMDEKKKKASASPTAKKPSR
jgi:hypothetical protein